MKYLYPGEKLEPVTIPEDDGTIEKYITTLLNEQNMNITTEAVKLMTSAISSYIKEMSKEAINLGLHEDRYDKHRDITRNTIDILFMLDYEIEVRRAAQKKIIERRYNEQH